MSEETTVALHTIRVELDADPGGWGRWEVRDDEDRIVGHVSEHREWLGHAHGPARFDVACRTEPMPAPACWNALGAAETLPEAVALLEQHRREEHDRGSRFVDEDGAGLDVHDRPEERDEEAGGE